MSQQIPFNSLDANVDGDVLMPAEGAFEEARQIWNSRLGKVPAAIVECASAADVAESIQFAREHRVRVSVRSGGHSYAGLGVCQGGLMIDLSKMNEIRIHRADLRGQVGAGTRWGEFHEAAMEEGLAATGGTVTSVGVAGFTLGGGSGWLSRKYGLAIDNLKSVEVVTAEGKILRASESENSDLFWGVRGGAGNFGIVTRFEFQLHEMSSEVYAGQILYPLRDAGRVLQVYREQMPKTPDEFVCFPCMFRIPPISAFAEELHDEVVLAMMMAHIGDVAEGKTVVNRFRGYGDPILEAVGPKPYLELQRSFDAGTPPGQRWYSRSHYLGELSDAAIETFLKHTADLPGPLTLAYFGAEDGAVSRVDPAATAFPHRNARFSLHILSGWVDPVKDGEVMKWTRAFHHEMIPFSTGGVYVNLLAEDEPDRVKAAYGSNYQRLAELKSKWDPDNLLCCNQNITPAPGASKSGD